MTGGIAQRLLGSQAEIVTGGSKKRLLGAVGVQHRAQRLLLGSQEEIVTQLTLGFS